MSFAFANLPGNPVKDVGTFHNPFFFAVCSSLFIWHSFRFPPEVKGTGKGLLPASSCWWASVLVNVFSYFNNFGPARRKFMTLHHCQQYIFHSRFHPPPPTFKFVRITSEDIFFIIFCRFPFVKDQRCRAIWRVLSSPHTQKNTPPEEDTAKSERPGSIKYARFSEKGWGRWGLVGASSHRRRISEVWVWV